MIQRRAMTVVIALRLPSPSGPDDLRQELAEQSSAVGARWLESNVESDVLLAQVDSIDAAARLCRGARALHACSGIAAREDCDDPGGLISLASDLVRCANPSQILLDTGAAEILRGRASEQYCARTLGEHVLTLDRPVLDVYQLDWGAMRAFPPIKSHLPIRHNLESRATPFVGRLREVEEILGLFHENRLVTLTGVSGIGKSSLAWRVAIEWLGEAKGSVWCLRVSSGATEETLIADLIYAASPKAVVGTSIGRAFRTSSDLTILYGADRAPREVADFVGAVLL